MYNLDKTKIDGLLKSLSNAGKNAVAGLNAMTDNEFKGSMMETDPLGQLGLIVRTLENARAKAEANAQYAGMSVEEITEAQEAERATEQQAILDKFNAKLAARAPKPVEPEPEPTGEPDGEPTGNRAADRPDDQQPQQ